MTLVGLDRFNYYFDAKTRPTMKNTTMLVHLAGNKDGGRLKYAHAFATRQHCTSSGELQCKPFSTPRCPRNNRTLVCQQRARRYKRMYSSRCSLRPDPRVCAKGESYPILPPKLRAGSENRTRAG